jgi:hypothetical protein
VNEVVDGRSAVDEELFAHPFHDFDDGFHDLRFFNADAIAVLASFLSRALFPRDVSERFAASFDNRSRMLMSPHVASAEVEPIPTFVHTHEQAGERFVEGEDVGVKPFADA